MPWFAALPFLHLINFSHSDCQRARFEKETRYYELHLQQDLLNDWVIVATNGRKKSKLGQSRTIAFLNYTEAFARFCTMTHVRHQRGYRLTTYDNNAAVFIHLLALLAIAKLSVVIPKRQKSVIIKQNHSPKINHFLIILKSVGCSIAPQARTIA